MPKIVKTVRSDQWTDIGTTASNRIAIEMMATALAAAAGTNYKAITDQNNTDHIDYVIDMKNLGYAGWCVIISRLDSNNNFNLILATLDQENEPNYNNMIFQYIGGENIVFNRFENALTTCVVFMDDTKDTVLINIHAGGTETASDVTNGDQEKIVLNVFLAKDAKNEVLGGIGWGHINKIRTLTSSMEAVIPIDSSHNIFQATSLGNSLHLTKMVNYLSPEYTEMKSAYVSVVRPIVTDLYKQNASFYADGGRWAYVGRCNPNGLGANSGFVLFPPFDPFVKY